MVCEKAKIAIILADAPRSLQGEEKGGGNKNKKPFDCIQRALEENVPDDQKRPERIAERLCYATAGMINTPPTTLMNLVFDAAAQGGCIEEIYNEVAGILAQDGNGWVDTSICKMKKLDSFVHESLRLSTFPVACACVAKYLLLIDLWFRLSVVLLTWPSNRMARGNMQ
jgi:hypothetical protein